jgi:hypothetical protein
MFVVFVNKIIQIKNVLFSRVKGYISRSREECGITILNQSKEAYRTKTLPNMFELQSFSKFGCM